MGKWQDFIHHLFGSSGETAQPGNKLREKTLSDEGRKTYPDLDIDFADVSLQELFSSGKLKSVSYDENKSGSFLQMHLSDNSWVTFFPKTGAWRRFFPNGSMLARYPDGSGFFEEKSDKTRMTRYSVDQSGKVTAQPLRKGKGPIRMDGNQLHVMSQTEGKKCVSGVEYPDGSMECLFEDGSRLTRNRNGIYGHYETRYREGSNTPASGPSWFDNQTASFMAEMQTGGGNVSPASASEWEKWQKDIDEKFGAALADDLQKKWTPNYNTSHETTKLKSIVCKRVGSDGALLLDVNVRAEWQAWTKHWDQESNAFLLCNEADCGPVRTRAAILDKNGAFKLYLPWEKLNLQTQRKLSVDINLNAGAPQIPVAYSGRTRPRAKTLGNK